MTHSLAFAFLVHCPGGHNVLLSFSESMCFYILFCTLLTHILWPFIFREWVSIPFTMHSSGNNLSKVSWLGIQYGLFWWHRLWPVLFQMVSWPGFNVDCSGDTDVACLVSVGELAWFQCALFWWHSLSSVLFLCQIHRVSWLFIRWLISNQYLSRMFVRFQSPIHQFYNIFVLCFCSK